MKNYLKKAISAVIALALAASMIPATLAANVALTDVPETADYATAVNTLVALNIVNGYEDNSFKPDNKITRAEASKIIVAALNETASAEAMKGATKFSDIEAKHEWATGYINKGVSMGYINGMENNQFQPDGNVTYAQVIKMMLCAMGYEDYAASLAQQYGYTGANWYIPFTQLAADAGVTDGVYAGPNEAVTRAQVAQLVYNAIKAPVVKNVGVRYTENGTVVPNVQVQNGEQSDYWKSILTEKFDAYFVEGYVLDTVKTASTTLEADEVRFGIAKSKDYANDDVRLDTILKSVAEVEASGAILDVVNVGDTVAASSINVYSTAIVMVDDYDDWKFVSFIPSGKNKSVEKDLALVYPAGSDETVLEFYNDDKMLDTTEYKLDTDNGTKVYVNGFYAGLADDVDDKDNADPSDDEMIIDMYVTTQENGKITLVDTYKTDGKYDTIYVDSYVRDMVTAISDDSIVMTAATLDLDKEENEDLEYHIYYNGEEITIADLKEDDVLSIAYDIRVSDIESSDYYEIYVSRDVVTGTLRKLPDMAAVIEDTEYKFAESSDYTTFKGDYTVGDKVKLYIDYFGKIFDWDMDESSANYAVVTKFYDAKAAGTHDYARITLFTTEGTKKVYDFDHKRAAVSYAGTPSTETLQDLIDEVEAYVGGLSDPQDMVVSYTVSASSGMINKLEFLAAEEDNSGASTKYDVARNKIGAIRLSSATKLIDASEFASEEILATASVDALIDQVGYKAYAYGNKVGNAYPFVLITEGQAAYTMDTRFAVVTEDGAATILVDGEPGYYEIEALYGSDKVVKLVATDDEKTELEALKAGDVIFFKTNAAGHIKEIDVIFTLFDETNGFSEFPTYTQLATASLVDDNYDNDVDEVKITSSGTNFGTGVFTQDWDAADADTVKLVYGPIAEVSKNSISFAILSGDETDLDSGVQEYDIAPSINVYKYDFGSTAKFKFSATTGTTGAAIVAPKYLTKLIEQNDDVIDWTDTEAKHYEKANFAFALVVEGEVVDIFEFIAD